MRRPALAVATLAAYLCGCAGARRPVPGTLPDAPPVRSLVIEGTHQLSDGRIAARLATRAPDRWPGSTAMPFDPVAWEEDLRRVARIYQAEGYYSAEVVDSEVTRRRDGVHLRIRVREGPPTRIRALEVTGLDGLPPDVREAAADEVRLRRGEVFRERDWVGSREAVERVLREHGYAEVTTGGEARVTVAQEAADVHLEVVPGRRYKLGALFLAAERGAHVPPGAILAEARAALPEGAWYSQSALQAAQARVFEMGLFSAVSVTAAAPEAGSDALPVVIEVREAPLRTGRAGVGIGAGPARTEARVSAEWIDRDFLGGLRTLRLRGRAGWAAIPTPWEAIAGGEPGRRQGAFGELWGELAHPRALGVPGLQLFGSLSLGDDLRPAYRYASVRLEAGIAYRVSEFVAIEAFGAVDATALSDTPLGGLGAPEPAYGCAAPCVLSWAEETIRLGRRRGYRERPEGGEAQLRLREGGGPVGGGFRFWEADVEVRGYFPVTARLLLAFHASAGSIFPAGGPVPVTMRYFGGGPDMRGYGALELAPLLLLPGGHGQPAVALPTGGRSLVQAQLEGRLRIGDRLDAAAFLDAGAVSSESFRLGLLARGFQLAPGVGARYRTALGPLRFDVAVLLPVGPELPAYAPPGSGLTPPTQGRGCFGGGGGRPGCAIHFSLGEAF